MITSGLEAGNNDMTSWKLGLFVVVALSMNAAPHPQAMVQHADQLLGAGRLTDAIGLYRSALATNPNLPDAWFNLGWALRAGRQFEDAAQAYAQALCHGVRHSEHVYLNLAAMSADHLHAPDAAEEQLKAALALVPDFAPALLSLGTLYEDRGQAGLARDVYQKVLHQTPGNGRAVARLAMIDLAEGNHVAALSVIDAALPSTASAEDAAEILFAKAAALDAAADYDTAFETLIAANGLTHRQAQSPYDRGAQERLVTRLIATFPAPRESNVCTDHPLKPIFIVGMFRSGSTLVEQLLGRHPAISVGGELEYIPALATTHFAPYPEAVAQTSETDIGTFRTNYLAEMARVTSAGWVTDKRCDNVLHLGLVNALFPDAPIIHTVRDPLDTLISTLFLHFGEGVSYGHDQRDAAHYYGQYRRLLNHWRDIFGNGLHDVDYDQLVIDPSPQVSSALESIGLPWHDACLRPSKGAATVRTASSWQVRKPLHRQSSGRWRHYARQLEPARQILAGEGWL
jgi:Flp pilus assembly protein TadD